MSWSQSLEVVGGEIEFEASTQKGIYTAKGLLHCAEAFKVRFQDARFRPSRPMPESAAGREFRFRVPSSVTEWEQRIQLTPRKLPDSSQPETFLDLCTRLVAPAPREDYGYIFSAHLRLNGWDAAEIEFDDQEYVHGSFVQFAQFQGPFAFVAWKRRYTCQQPRLHGLTCAEELRFMLIHELGWPPDEL